MMEFQNELTPAQREIVEALAGLPEADDGKKFLFNRKIGHRRVAKIAREVGEAVTAQVVGEGRIETLSDGTRYEVTARGWKKL